jgi:hypothetical protein
VEGVARKVDLGDYEMIGEFPGERGWRYITDWKELDKGKTYVVFPINGRDGKFYLAQPTGRYSGTQVPMHKEGCYAALEIPKFTEEDLPKCLTK